MKKYYFIALAAIAVLSSCSNKEDFGQASNNNQKKVFIGTIENNPTRATFDEKENCASWEVGDLVSINGANYSAKSAGTTTTFEAEVSGVEAEGELYKAYFPANLYKEGTPTLPATQIYEKGKFNMPMYAESTTTNLEFKNICAVLAIKITSDDIDTLKSIKVESDKHLCGDFTIIDNKAVISVNLNAKKVVELQSEEALTLDEDGIVFYIAIPAQEYKYLNIFLSADGETYTQAMATQKKDGLGEINRNTICEIDYKKNATKLWEGNLFFADYNVGVTDGKAESWGGFYTWGGTYANGGEDIPWTDDHYTEPFEEYYTEPFDLNGDNDTATKLWGSNWRMLTQAECEALINSTNCTVEWIDGSTKKYNNTSAKGLLCTGKSDYKDNSVFLPAVGYRLDDDIDVRGLYGYYWSSTYDGSDKVYLLYFEPGNQLMDIDQPNFAFSVRAVLAE